MDALDLRLHGRGGQGVVTMAALLVDAAFRSGWHALGFPAFGTERTGAPVAAFVRLDQVPIRDRSEVREPSVVVVADLTLLGAVDVAAGARPDALFVVNAPDAPPVLDGARVVTVDASTLAREHLGRATTNTAMLGALAAATGIVSIDAVVRAIQDAFAGDLGARNEAVARAAYDAVEAGKVTT